MLKSDVFDSFDCIGRRPSNGLKLSLIFPVDDGIKPMVAIPLALTMEWNKLPSLFCTAKETIADLANKSLRAYAPFWSHKLEDR